MLWHVLISLAEDSHFSCAFTQALVESVDMFGAFLCNGHTVSAGGQRGACGTTKSPFGTANRLCPMVVTMSAARGSTERSSVYRGSGLRAVGEQCRIREREVP